MNRQNTKLLAGSFFALLIIPVLFFLEQKSSAPLVSDFHLGLLAKYFCYSVVAIGLYLTWGLCGILSLGQGVFFALGGYCSGMYLMHAIGADSVYGSKLPDFMVFLDWQEFPWYWLGFDHLSFALMMAFVVPSTLAFLFSFFAFKARINGVYFSIITQALCFGTMLLFYKNELGFGGNNGLTDFKRIGQYSLQSPGTKAALYMASLLLLYLAIILAMSVKSSLYGKVLTAIRDQEQKVRSTGYNTVLFKTTIFTLAAGLSGLAGALFTPIVGIINPSEMLPAASIEMIIWLAVGGRTSIIGAILGTFIICGLKSYMTSTFPDYWLIVLGTLFILITRYLPNGLAGLKDLNAKSKAKSSFNNPKLRPDLKENYELTT